jgi:hypothetical protein
MSATQATTGSVVLSSTPQSVAKAEASTDCSIVVQLAAKGAFITISKQDEALFNALFNAQATLSAAMLSADVFSVAAVRARYGDDAPSFEAYTATKACFGALAKHRGLMSTQYIDKPFNTAIKALYGAKLLEISGGHSDLPVSMTPAAVQKRASRVSLGQATKSQKDANKAAVGAVKGVTSPRSESVAETIEQFIARVGPGKVLAELSKILSTARETMTDAKVLDAIAKHYK